MWLAALVDKHAINIPMLRTLSVSFLSAPTQRICLPGLAVSMRSVYSPKVMDHYKNPRNVGTLDGTQTVVGTSMVGAPECGDSLHLSVQVNEKTQVIEDAKFKAFGCGSAIAASSFASELIKGKTLAEAMELTNKDIAAELSLPPVKLHCSMLAAEAIHQAINNYLSKDPQRKVKRTRPAPTETAAAPEAASAEATK